MGALTVERFFLVFFVKKALLKSRSSILGVEEDVTRFLSNPRYLFHSKLRSNCLNSKN